MNSQFAVTLSKEEATKLKDYLDDAFSEKNVSRWETITIDWDGNLFSTKENANNAQDTKETILRALLESFEESKPNG